MKGNWWKAWIAQFAVMIIVCTLAELSYYISGVLHGILIWAVVPLIGAVTAAKSVLKGLNNYAAWIAPPVCMAAAGLILWGYVPGAGPVLVCAFVSLVGAATGEVMSQARRKDGRR